MGIVKMIENYYFLQITCFILTLFFTLNDVRLKNGYFCYIVFVLNEIKFCFVPWFGFVLGIVLHAVGLTQLIYN
jgi:hypothetical protein